MSDKKKRSRRGVREVDSTEVEVQKYTKRFKFEKENEKFFIGFPLVNEKSGAVRVKEIPNFSVKFGKKLSDDKWHKFQLPESDKVYEMCKKHPNLEEGLERIVLIVVYDDNPLKTKKDINYHFEYIKLTDTRLKMLDEIIDEVSDEGYEDISQTLILAKLNKSKNSLKMQDFILLLKGDSPAYNNKCVDKWKDIKKEALKEWDGIEDKVVNIEDDDTIVALLDTDDDEDDRKSRRSKRTSKKKKRKMSKKDLD